MDEILRWPSREDPHSENRSGHAVRGVDAELEFRGSEGFCEDVLGAAGVIVADL
jgi:hypothetical protein